MDAAAVLTGPEPPNSVVLILHVSLCTFSYSSLLKRETCSLRVAWCDKRVITQTLSLVLKKLVFETKLPA